MVIVRACSDVYVRVYNQTLCMCASIALIRTCDTKAFAGQGCFSPCLLYLFFTLSTLPLLFNFVILWRCLALREKANQNGHQAMKSLHRRHYRVKAADMPTCLSNHGTLQLPAIRLPPFPPVAYHKHRHLTCWTVIIKASVYKYM